MQLSQIDSVRNSPCASYWLKESLDKALNRDIMDAIRDAETLLALLHVAKAKMIF